jgi:hypothetical protein
MSSNIHNKPVEEGIVFEPQDYTYNSAVDYFGGRGRLDNICIF